MLDITEIERGLWQGAHPYNECPGEIKIIINLCDNCLLKPYHKYVEEVLLSPIDDIMFPGLEWLDILVDYIIRCRRANKIVLVHCLAGISRSAFVTAAYFVKTLRMQPAKALKKVQMRRWCVCPAPMYTIELDKYYNKLFGEIECLSSRVSS